MGLPGMLNAVAEKFVILDRITSSDGMGGFISTYVEGAEFEAVVELTNSLEESVAMQQGVSGIYDVTVSRNMRLKERDIFKRVSDGKTFRITSKDESKTPKTTELDIRKARAEEYQLADE